MCSAFEAELIKWATLAQTFLKSAKFQASCIAKSGNPNFVVADAELSEEDYEAKTEANDRNLAVPTLYSFFHGLELLLKGALSAGNALGKKNHDLKKLFDDFKKSYPNEEKITDLFSQALDVNAMGQNNPVRKFCERNDLTPARFYEALRYPDDHGGQAFIHYDLKYNEADGAAFFQNMVKIVDRIIPLFVALSRSRRS
jgi:hypothetical protein